jgi:hypothetical protein
MAVTWVFNHSKSALRAALCESTVQLEMLEKSETNIDTVLLKDSGTGEERAAEDSHGVRYIEPTPIQEHKPPDRWGASFSDLSLAPLRNGLFEVSHLCYCILVCAALRVKRILTLIWLVVSKNVEDCFELLQLLLKEVDESGIKGVADITEEGKIVATGLEIEVGIHWEVVRCLQVEVRYDLQRNA